MKTIWKFPLSYTSQSVHMPSGARALCAQMQGDVPCLWMLVDTDAKPVARDVWMFSTGERLPPVIAEKAEYIGTVQFKAGRLVFHVFLL